MSVQTVPFDSRTNLRGERGICNDLWLYLITVSIPTEAIRGMECKGEGEMGRAEFISPHRVVAVPRGLTTSHLIYPLSRVMFDSFFVANTTTRDDYAESLQKSGPRPGAGHPPGSANKRGRSRTAAARAARTSSSPSTPTVERTRRGRLGLGNRGDCVSWRTRWRSRACFPRCVQV